MKRLILLACLTFLLSICVSGQINKKAWLFGGNITFSSTTYNSDAGQKNTGYVWDIAPDIGYFIMNKWAVGARVNIHKIGSKATGTNISSTYTSGNYGVFSRYYFLPKDNLANIIIDGTFLYGQEKGDFVSMHKQTLAIMAGPVIYFNSSVGLEFLMGYETYKFVGIEGRNNSIQLSLGFHIHLQKEENKF